MEFPGEKLVLKMWETLIEKGIGSVLTPWHEKRLGEARNYIRRNEIIMLAEAEKMAADIKSGKVTYTANAELKTISSSNTLDYPIQRIESTISLPDFASRANNLDTSESIRREVNVSKAVIVAEEILSQDTQEPPNKNIDDDWLYSWRDYAGRVSSSELQDLWGRILAGEVKNPGSYSFRTLEFLKGLSKQEAEVISKVAKYVIAGRIFRNKETFLKEEDIHFTTLLFLQEIGVISGVEAVGLTTTWNSSLNDKYFRALISHDKAIILEHTDVNNKAVSEVYILTSIGTQILGLASFRAENKYLKSISVDFAKQGYKVILADWKQTTANEGEYFNGVEINAND